MTLRQRSSEKESYPAQRSLCLHDHLLTETEAIILLSPDTVNQEIMISRSFRVNPLLKVTV